MSAVVPGVAGRDELSEEEINKLYHLTSIITQKAANDLSQCLGNLKKNRCACDEVHSGTAGSYYTRVAFEAFKSIGVKTYSYMHSGSLTHVDYRFDPRFFIEYSVPDGFYVFNREDKEILDERIKKSSYKLDVRVMKNANNFCRKSFNSIYREVDGRSVKNVTFVSQLFTGDVRHFGLPDDIMSVSFEYRLFSILRDLGKEIKLKVHPKGINRNNVLVQKAFPEVKFLRSSGMSSLCNDEHTEMFVVRKVDSTAFNEIMRSDKPAIIINDSSTDELTREAKQLLRNRAHIVNAGYKDGLAYVDKEQLSEAFCRSYMIDYCFSTRYQI